MKTALIWSAVLLGALSSGCGGGAGGSSAMQSSPTPQNLESAPAPAQPFNIPSATLTASSGGNSYTATYSATPNNGTTMYDGQEANSSTISLTITENGSAILTEVDTAYYLKNPYQPLGLTITHDMAHYFDALYNSTNPLPSTLTVGSSGPLDSGIFRNPIGGGADNGSLTETYSVASNDGSTVLLTTYATGTVSGQSISETIDYAVNASGGFELQSIEIQVSGTTLTFTNSCSGCWDY
jgi:hypothetical protein